MENNNNGNLKLVINALNDEVLEKNPSCFIKYESDKNAQEYKFDTELKINEKVEEKQGNGTEGGNGNTVEISINPPTLKSGDKKLNIEYFAYICDTIIKDVTLFPKFLVGKPGCQEVKVIEDKIIFIKEEGKEYSIAVQATVLNEDNNNEVFIYQKFITNEDKRKNDLIFFIIMGSFAFVIIFVFILIFYIINKRKKNNPDIDDEDYNKIPVLRETINEDES